MWDFLGVIIIDIFSLIDINMTFSSFSSLLSSYRLVVFVTFRKPPHFEELQYNAPTHQCWLCCRYIVFQTLWSQHQGFSRCYHYVQTRTYQILLHKWIRMHQPTLTLSNLGYFFMFAPEEILFPILNAGTVFF